MNTTRLRNTDFSTILSWKSDTRIATVFTTAYHGTSCALSGVRCGAFGLNSNLCIMKWVNIIHAIFEWIVEHVLQSLTEISHWIYVKQRKIKSISCHTNCSRQYLLTQCLYTKGSPPVSRHFFWVLANNILPYHNFSHGGTPSRGPNGIHLREVRRYILWTLNFQRVVRTA